MATRRRSASKSTPKSDVVTEEDINAAVSIIKRDYYQDVRGICDEIEEAVKDGQLTDDEEVSERIHQEVDGSARVIYTWQNHLGLLASDNSDAYMEEFGEVPTDGDSINYAALMAAAMEADVRDALGNVEFPDED
jgi:hypothetical protein